MVSFKFIEIKLIYRVIFVFNTYFTQVFAFLFYLFALIRPSLRASKPACLCISLFLPVCFIRANMVFRYYPATTARLVHIIPSFIQYKGQPFLSSPFISSHSIIIPLTSGNCGNCCPLHFATPEPFVMPSQSLLLPRSPCLYSL